MDRDQRYHNEIQKGTYLVGGGGSVSALPADIATEFDGRIERANKILDDIAALKAKERERQDWIDLSWRVPWR